MTRLRPRRFIENRFQGRVGDVVVQRPQQLRNCGTPKRLAHRRRRTSNPDRNRLLPKSLLKSIS